ncbi:MAG: hypothetical protein ACRDOM_04990 [Nocardioides sp.]
MADEDRDEPSLELPSLGFGRRRRRKRRKTAAAADESAPGPTPEPEPDPEPVPEPDPEPGPEPAAEPVAETSPTTILDDPVSGPHEETRVRPATTGAPEAGDSAEQGRPLFSDETPPESGSDDAQPAASRKERRRERKERRGARPPSVGGMPAAIITGALVGALTVGLTWAALRGCEAVKGASSCGGPGLLLLVAILVAMIVLGSFLLRAWGVPDPGSTSFLAVGLLAVLTLLFLMDALFDWWIVIIIPVLAILTFALAHWVTVAFIEPGDS